MLLLAIGMTVAAWFEWDKVSRQSVENKALAKKFKNAALAANQSAEKAKKNEQVARAQARIATSRQLAALSVSERNKRLDRSLLLAVEALHAENTFEARDSLFKALKDRRRLECFLNYPERDITCVALRPDGKSIAAGYHDSGAGGVVVWDAAGRNLLTKEPLAVKEGYVSSVAFSPDGKTIAAGYGGGRRRRRGGVGRGRRKRA